MRKQITHFIRLLNFEFERMYKFLISIMTVVIISNLIGFIVVPLSYINRAKETMSLDSLSMTQYLMQYSSFSISDALNSLWVYGPLALGIIGFLFYSFYIWYREWLGKNTFIYRILMLPIQRISIYFAKVLTIFLGIFSLLSLQYILIRLSYFISPSLIPSELYSHVDINEVLESNQIFAFILPESLGLFTAFYFFGLVFILVIFTGILLERSFRIKGFFFGIIYAIASMLFIFSPNFIPTILKNNYILFPSETLLAIIVMAIAVGIGSLLVSNYLLKHKITV